MKGLGGPPTFPGMTMEDAQGAASRGAMEARRAPSPIGKVPTLRCVTPPPNENYRNGRRNAVGDESPDGGAVGASTADDNGIARAGRKRWGGLRRSHRGGAVDDTREVGVGRRLRE